MKKARQYEPMSDGLFEAFCALKKFEEAYFEGTKDYSGCDWCCGGGDEWRDELEEGFKELGCETVEEFNEKLRAEKQRRGLT